jgi:hypothetical protein
LKRLCFFLALAFVALGSTPAVAADADLNCAYLLAPTGVTDGDVIEAELVDLGCYATFAEAVEVGTSGSVTLSADASASSLTQAELTASTSTSLLASDVLIGTEWVWSNYSGESSSYFAPQTCSAGVTWEVSYVTDYFNDRFNAGKGFGGCDRNKKFAASNFGGDVLTCTPNCADYGTLSNRVSSLRWKP